MRPNRFFLIAGKAACTSAIAAPRCSCDERLQIVQRDIGKQRRPDHAGVVHDMRDGEARGDIGGGLSGRGGIYQIDLDGV